MTEKEKKLYQARINSEGGCIIEIKPKKETKSKNKKGNSKCKK